MPQMAPLNWLTLFFLFSITLLIFSSMNYFSFLYPANPASFKTPKNNISWKW
uniref:ATP synthase complex subunit 8 n=1 Tax=Euchirus longimanus TaxID=1968892 RepID=A0AAU6QEJ8_9SCAR